MKFYQFKKEEKTVDLKPIRKLKLACAKCCLWHVCILSSISWEARRSFVIYRAREVILLPEFRSSIAGFLFLKRSTFSMKSSLRLAPVARKLKTAWKG